MKLGVDIGGTEIKFGVVDDAFATVEKFAIPTPRKYGESIVESIAEVCLETAKKYPVEGIGIGSPGIIDGREGVILRASNLPFLNTPVTEPLRARTGTRVVLGNDASCAMLGELYAGYGREYDDMLMITLGTGVGGGIIIDKKPYFGKNGSAGEFGHMVVEFDGLPCGCGRKGCFEKYASVSALIGLTVRAVEENPKSLLAEMSGAKIDGRTAFNAMKEGCPVAQQVVDEYISHLAVGVENLIMLFQPEIIVFGGAISNEGDWLLNPLRSKIVTDALLVCSRLKNDAGYIGAAAQLLDEA